MALDFTFDPEKMKQEQEDIQNKKGLLGVAGTALQGMQNVPSSYEMLYGKKSDRPDIQGMFKQAADSLQDPYDKQKKAMEGYLLSRQGTQAQEADALSTAKKDPNSKQSLALKALAPRWGIEVKPEMSASDIEQMIDPKKMMETEAASKVDFEKQKALRGYESGLKKSEDKFKAELDNKNLPQNVYAAATYGKRLEDANKQIEDIIAGGYDPTSKTQALKNKLTPDAFLGEKPKLMDQAQRNFINAVLRRESGSAISAQEFESGNKQYFPQPGDTPDVLAQKQRNREVALAGLKAEGAKAWDKIEGNLPPMPVAKANNSNQSAAVAAPKNGDLKEWGGKTYKVQNGQWVEVR